ncbi:kelch-like protein 31 [Branchiostoma floridae x Branchiostoma belcheri]
MTCFDLAVLASLQLMTCFSPTGQVMSHVRFPLLSIEDLVRHVRTVDFMRRDQDCRALVMEATRYQKCPTQQILQQTRRTQVRSASQVLVVVGGSTVEGEADESREVLYLDPSLSSSWKPDAELPWQQVEELPSRGRMYHAVAVLDNFLYVAGGFSKCVWLSTFQMYNPRWNKWFELQHMLDPRSEFWFGDTTCLDTFERYDPRFDKWLELTPLSHPRSGFSLLPLDGGLFIIGGRLGRRIFSTVERYLPLEDRWEYAAGLDVGLLGHACCVHGNGVYISGGRSIARGRNGFRLYDPESGVTELTPLRHARSNHAMVAVPGGFLVLGGENGTTTIAQVEMYSLAGDCWMEVSTWPFPVCWFGHCVLNRTLYVFGGFTHANSKYTDTVQTLDLDRWEKWEWSIMGRLPYKCDGIAAAILTLPEQFKREAEARSRTGSHSHG